MNDSSSSNMKPSSFKASNYFQIPSNYRRRSSSGGGHNNSFGNNSSFEYNTSQQQQFNNNNTNRNSIQSLFLIPPPSLSIQQQQLSNINPSTLSTTSPMYDMINSFTLTTVLSQMIVNGNSQVIDETTCKQSVSTMVSNNTSSAIKLPISVLELSQLYSILLVVRKNLQDSSTKVLELVEWQKSLKQLGILPILVFQNSKQEQDEFFQGNQWNGTIIDVNNMLRVSDLNFELSKQLFNVESPIIEQENDCSLSDRLVVSETVESKMFLIRNGIIVWESSKNPKDQVVGTILSTVVLKLPWYAMSTDEISSDESQHVAPSLSAVNTSLNNLNQSYKSSCSLSSGGLRNSIRMDGGACSPSNSSTSAGGVSTSIIRIGSLVNDQNSFIVPAGLSFHGAMNVIHTITNNLNGNFEETFEQNSEQTNIVQENLNNEELTENRMKILVEQVEIEENDFSTIGNFTPNRIPSQKEQSFISTMSSDKMTHNASLGTPLLGSDSRYCSSIASMNSTLIENSASSLDLSTLMMPSPNITSSSSIESAEILIQNRKLSIFKKLRGRSEIEKLALEQEKLEQEMQNVKKKEIITRSQTNLYEQQSNNQVSQPRRSIFSICFGSSKEKTINTTEKTLAMYDPVESHLSEMYQIMHDDMKRQYFKLFSLKQFSAENLLFWEDVKLFYKKIVIELKRQQQTKQRFSLKSSQSDINQPPNLSNISKESIIELHDKIMKMAKYIGDKYLFEKESVYCLNTSNKMIEQVKSKMTLEGLEFINIAENIFDDVVTEVIKTVLPDMFCRFVLSNEYEEMQRVLQLSKIF